MFLVLCDILDTSILAILGIVEISFFRILAGSFESFVT